MEFEFQDKNLINLYTKGISRKYKFLNKNAINNFLDCVNNIEAAISIHDWWKLPALNFEKMRGYKNRFSMRIDKQHRLEIEIDFEDENKTKGFVTILKITKHYK